MKAFIVDDERLAAARLKKLLEKDIGGVEVLSVYTIPSVVIEQASVLKPDVVFLDIHMPGINGLELGELLQEVLPDVELVFVTGYDHYAVRAFELYALDYIVKPVRVDRLRLTVQRLRVKRQEAKTPEAKLPSICCFKALRFQFPGQEPRAVKWRTSKAQELFAYLLHHRNVVVDHGTIMELFWPEMDVPKAMQQMYTTIYHIRKVLKSEGLTSVTITRCNHEAGYLLTIGQPVELDVEIWEQSIRQLDSSSSQDVIELEEILQQYTGDYLADYDYLWAEHERERLRQQCITLMSALVKLYLDQGQKMKASRVYGRMQQLFPYEEEGYFGLMKLYDLLGESAKVDEQYRLLKSRLADELEVDVHHTINEWYKRWKQYRSEADPRQVSYSR
ncbi:response regulator [Paenibacillus sp. GCM10027626]|uniref:response regulator n=1 Tax=Paenibacillus sp. GCM10027626 TaxID=3273411 RepID=UPI00363204CD